MTRDSLDSLYTRVAKKVLTETLRVQKGESITVEAWDNGVPFARRALAEARALGCTAVLLYEDEAAYVEGVRRAPEDAVGAMGKNEYGALSGTDAYIFVPGQAIGVYSRTLKPEERERSIRYNSAWYEAAAKAGLRGARLSFGYVGKDLARLLGRPIREVVRAQLTAALADYQLLGASAGKVSPRLAEGAEGSITSGKTELRFTLKGELGVEDGRVDEDDKKAGDNVTYIPPGFVSKGVDPASVNGNVTLTDSLTKYGVVRRAELEFKDGVLVNWRSKERALLQKVLEAVSPEKRRVTLLAVGLNPEISYGWALDRFVGGSLTLSGFGFTGLVKNGNLKVGGASVLENGKLGP